MSPKLRTKLVWGWLRLVLGIAQTTFSATAFLVALQIGLKPLTWSLAFGGAAAMIASRMLYHGKSRPNDEVQVKDPSKTGIEGNRKPAPFANKLPKSNQGKG